MSRSARLHLIGLATATTLLASPTPSRAEGATGGQPTEQAKNESVHSAWPYVLGGAGVLFGATTVYFLDRSMDLRSQGADMAKVVPAGESPCAPNGNARFCELDRDARTASMLTIGSAVASLSFFAAAAIVFVREGSAAPKAQTTVAPVAGPGVAGAALVTTF